METGRNSEIDRESLRSDDDRSSTGRQRKSSTSSGSKRARRAARADEGVATPADGGRGAGGGRARDGNGRTAGQRTAGQTNGRTNGRTNARANGRAADEQELRRLLSGLREMSAGRFTTRLPEEGTPLMVEIAGAFNDVAELRERLTNEIVRISTSVGREGQMTDRADLGPAGGDWARTVTAVNSLITDLVTPTTEVGRVIEAVARGDLSQKMVLQIDGKMVQGEFLRIGTTVNTMVDQLSSFAAEVTRVAREVGTDGRLGGQANVPGVAGTWKDLTDSVNAMASNLTDQVRNIADVTTAVAKGDLSRKITVQARGEVLELKNTINTMVDQLNAFADEVTRVAREVGTEGKLGGQARVETSRRRSP